MLYFFNPSFTSKVKKKHIFSLMDHMKTFKNNFFKSRWLFNKSIFLWVNSWIDLFKYKNYYYFKIKIFRLKKGIQRFHFYQFVNGFLFNILNTIYFLWSYSNDKNIYYFFKMSFKIKIFEYTIIKIQITIFKY